MKFKLQILFYYIKYRFFHRFKNRESLLKFQRRKWKSFKKRILTRSAYYARLLNDDEMPSMDKSRFMEHFDEINTVGLHREDAMNLALSAERSRDFSAMAGDITVGLSTGTSGKRGLFLASKKERAMWTAMVMVRVLKPRWGRKQKVAFFLRANSNLYESVQSGLFEFRYFDLMQPIETNLKNLADFYPDVIGAPASMLIHIAHQIQEGRLAITPYQVTNFAEVLDKEDLIWIESVLKCKVSNVYQCTEGFLGATCTHGTLHLNEDIAMIKRDYVGEGIFRPVITDFTRETQPVINYMLDDLLVESSEACPCGNPMLAIDRIIGRQGDVLEFFGKAVLPDNLSRVISVETDEFGGYMVHQTGPETLTIYLDTGIYKPERAIGQFRKAITGYLLYLGIVDIKLEFVLGLPMEPGDKWRKISNRYKKVY